MKIWGMSMWKVMSIFVVALGLFMLGTSVPAQADVSWSGNISCSGTGCTLADDGITELETYYADPNGLITVSATNTSNVGWGDFHFFIFGLPNNDPTNVKFNVTTPNQPTSSQSPLTWNLDGTGKYLDLNFYSNPVNPGVTGTFGVYVKNPDAVQFGVGFYPSVVPEPISSTLFIVGAATLGVRRFIKKKVSV
jgi:hypothetical protein